MTLTIEEYIQSGEKELAPYAPFEEIADLNEYDWPIDQKDGTGAEDSIEVKEMDKEEEDKIFHVHYYRRVTNFRICDVFGGRMKPFHIEEEDPSNYFLLLGDLLPYNHGNASCQKTQTVAIKVPIIEIFYNFGLEEEGSKDRRTQLLRDARLEEGFWVRDYLSTLYHLVAPAVEAYRRIYEMAVLAARRQFNPVDAHFGRRMHVVDDYVVYDRDHHHTNPTTKLSAKYLFLFGRLTYFDEVTNKAQSIKIQFPFNKLEVSLGNKILSPINQSGILIPHLNGRLWLKLGSSSDHYKFQQMLSNYLDSVETLLGSCNKTAKFYQDPYRWMTHFDIIDYEGESLQKIFPKPRSSDQECSLYSLSGTILKSKEEVVRIRTFGNDYVVDIGYRNEEVSFYFKSLDSIMYRLKISAETKFPTFESIIRAFNWPSESDEIWRRIKDYSLYDQEGNFTSLLTKEDIAILRGSLIAREGTEDLSVQCYVQGYSVDYGKDLVDENRGLWLLGCYPKYWFKLMYIPRNEYEPYAKVGLIKTKKFLRLHETLIYSDPPLTRLCAFSPEYICDYTIQELYKKSNKNFDLQFVYENKLFIVDNLNGLVGKAKSRRFYKSLDELSVKSVAECLNESKQLDGATIDSAVQEKLQPTTTYDISKVVSSKSEGSTVAPDDSKVGMVDKAKSSTVKVGSGDSMENSVKSKRKATEAELDESASEDVLARPIKRKALDPEIPRNDGDVLSKPLKRKVIEPEIPSPALDGMKKLKPVEVSKPKQPAKLIYPSTQPAEPKNATSLFCSYCRGLKKNPKCFNNRHRDGLPLDLSNSNCTASGDRALCPRCQSIRKSCSDQRHVDGCEYPYIPPSPAAGSLSKSSNVKNVSFPVSHSISYDDEGFDIDKLQAGEKKEKNKYFEHHSIRKEESAEALAAKLVPLLPLSRHSKTPIERLKESSMSSLGVFRETTKYEPMDKTAKPEKSILKVVSQNFDSAPDAYDLNHNRPITPRVVFADGQTKPLNQFIPYHLPSPEHAEEN